MKHTAIIWPEVFTNPDFEYDPKDELRASSALADGLEGWACCALEKQPDGFGNGMVKIGALLGCSTRVDALHHKAYELGLPNAKGIGCNTCTLKDTKHCQGCECYTRDYIYHTTAPLS